MSAEGRLDVGRHYSSRKKQDKRERERDREIGRVEEREREIEDIERWGER